jgi:uncharacterized protein YraI
MFMHKARTIALAAALVVGSALPALAVSAVATSNVNVRSCGSTDCRVVDVLRSGERVEIDYCQGSWCAVSKRGLDGWVSANYLSRDGRDRYDDRRYDNRRYDRRDDGFYIRPGRPGRHLIRPYDPGFSACLGGPNARFCIYD